MSVSAPSQALYMWMCDYAGSDGVCFPSRSTLAERLNCSVRSVDEYIKELEGADLVKREHRFSGNEKISNNYYIPLWGGSANIAPPRANSAQGVGQNLPIELNPYITQPNTIGAKAPLTVVEENPRKKADTAYKEVFEVFSPTKQGWMMHKPQIQAAKRLLAERGITQIRSAMRVYLEHKGEKYLPEIYTPFDLEAKWSKLFAFTKRV